MLLTLHNIYMRERDRDRERERDREADDKMCIYCLKVNTYFSFLFFLVSFFFFFFFFKQKTAYEILA